MPPTAIPGGLLVVIEGIDGSGKTTLVSGLADRLRRSDAVPVLGKEPTSGPWGMKLRQSAVNGRLSPEDEVRFLISDRKQHVDSVIAPALARGQVVILDRYYPSMVAYQGAAGVDPDELHRLNEFAPRPDLLVLLDVSPSVGLARISTRGDVPNAFEDPASLAAARAIFLSLRAKEPHMLVVNAEQSVEQVLDLVHFHVLQAISRKFAESGGLTAESVEALRGYMRNVL